MTLMSYTRLQLARKQLETAIGLFISGRDRFSVITLAGASDVILSRLVSNKGVENFTEHSMQQELERGEPVSTKEAHGRALNDVLFINQLKHMDDSEDGFIDLDPEECAVGAILKALANYTTIAGREDEFVVAFLTWVRLNLDPKKYNIYCEPNWMPSQDGA